MAERSAPAGARVDRGRKVSGTTPILRDDDDGLDYEDVGPTAIEPAIEPSSGVERSRVRPAPTSSQPSEPLPFEPLPSEPPAPGELVGGRYRLERVLGRGAAGVVYEATHEAIGKRVALKVLSTHASRSPDAVARFFREAHIAASLEHPNVVQVFDGGQDEDRCFLAMELVDGVALSAHLARGSASVTQIVQLFLQITHGVAAVHDAGVVHRDLKPDNVLLAGPERTPKVLDFGISKLAVAPTGLTTLGAVMGTPYYMAPEQVADTRSVDARADVYALGVMLYEALTGRLPYEGESVLQIYRLATTGRCDPAHHLRPEVPPALSAVVAKALCPDPSARFRDARALREALASVSFDGRDDGLDLDAGSEPWMLAETEGDELGPIETAQTRVGPAPTASGPRPVVSDRAAAELASPHPLGMDRVEGHPLDPLGGHPLGGHPLGVPPSAWILLALGAASFGALAAALLYLLAG